MGLIDGNGFECTDCTVGQSGFAGFGSNTSLECGNYTEDFSSSGTGTSALLSAPRSIRDCELRSRI